MPSPLVYNSCWMMWCSKEARAYRRDTSRVQLAQERRLRSIISRNQASWYGSMHHFPRVRDVDQFRRLVPLTTYDDYKEPMERIASGEAGVLTSERVELLEPTSGTTTAEKLIPYTAGLRREFQRAIRVWIGDLFSGRPAVRRGYAYWSISPLAHEQRMTPGGIPIGFDDDASYLGNVERLLLSKTMAVPPSIATCDSLSAAFYATLFFLLRCPQLSLISVWSPTFLSGMFHLLRTQAEQLCEDVARGTISTDAPSSLDKAFTPQPSRADQLRAILLQPELGSNWAQDLWPDLALVSCWKDGPSSVYAAQLQHQLPGVEIQPKGLLSTEAFVSLPLLGLAGASLAIRSHFFEFQAVDSTGEPLGDVTQLAHEVELGGQYRVVVTTSGGLYRYQTMDQVRVIGFYNQAPLLRFVGKCDCTSDLVGEKLNAAFVQSVLERTLAKLDIVAQSVELSPQCREQPYYLLRLVDNRLAQNHQLREQLRAEVEAALRDNSHYAYAIDAGQLGRLKIATSAPGQDPLESRHTISGGHDKLHHGNFKPRILSPPS